MPKLFNCIACSAPLEFEGTTIQKCRYCGASVIVPGEMFQSAESRTAPPGKFGGRAERLEEIRRLIRSGHKIEAIKVFRETFGTGLKEAKDAVEAIERGEGYDLTHAQTAPAQVDFVLDYRKRRGGFGVAGKLLKATAGSIVIFAGIGIALYLSVNEEVPAGSAGEPSFLSDAAAKGAEANGPAELLRIGGEGTGVGRFKDNRVVAVDGRGMIYSGDYSGGRVQAFNPDGSFATQWELADGDLIVDLVAARDGRVYILSNKGIRAYSAEGRSPGAFHESYELRGMATLPDGRVVAVGRKEILLLDPALKVLTRYGKAAEDANASLGFEKVAVDAAGTMFAIERNTGEIVKFSKEGKFLNRIPTGGRSPNGIALDPAGNIYVTQTSSITVLSPDGRPLGPIKATQAFGLTFNDAGEMFVASRPYVIKQKLAVD